MLYLSLCWNDQHNENMGNKLPEGQPNQPRCSQGVDEGSYGSLDLLSMGLVSSSTKEKKTEKMPFLVFSIRFVQIGGDEDQAKIL